MSEILGMPLEEHLKICYWADQLARLQEGYQSNKALFENAATREVTLKVGGKDVVMSGQKYFTGAFLPNFFFHMTTAYNILRGIGIELGKGDFLGRT